MKITKTKNFTSKIICSTLLILIIVINGRILPVAYAEEAAEPKKEATETCASVASEDATWKDLSPDAFKCKKEYGPKDKESTVDEFPCSALKSSNQMYTFRRMDSESMTPKEATDANIEKPYITCIKQMRAVPGNADLAKDVQVLLGVQQFLNRAIWPILVLTGSLMENDLLFGHGMEEKLRDIWIPIRNLVNILFVVVLVGIALYNVLGLGDEGGKTSIKDILPKLIIGIIAVNFSFVAIKVFLDGINALTVSIFALPGQVNEGLESVLSDPPDPKMVKKLCGQLEGSSSGTFSDQDDSQLQAEQKNKIYQSVASDKKYGKVTIAAADTAEQVEKKIKDAYGSDKSAVGLQTIKDFNAAVQAKQNNRICTGQGLTPQGKVFLSKYNSRNAAFAMALNMGKIVFYDDLATDVNNAEKLFTNTLFSLLLYFIYAASFLALFVVLLGRLVVMWLCVAVSPVLLLMMATPSLKDKFGGLGKLQEQFIKNAVAPLLISLSLTIGWIMLRAVQSLNLSQNASKFISSSVSVLAMDPSNGVPVGGLYTIQDFMVAVGVIAVVWIGVFSAAEGTVASFATEWMKGQLLSAGKWVGSLPFKHMPMVPISVPGHPHKTVTLGSVKNYMEKLVRGSENEKDEELWDTFHKDKKTGHSSELASVKDMGALRRHLNKATDLGEKDHIEKAKTWLSDNRGLVDQIRISGTLDEKNLIKSLEKLTTGNATAVKEAVTDIKKNPLVKTPPKASETAPAAPTTPAAPGTATPPQPTGVSPDRPIGGKPFKEIVPLPEDQTAISAEKIKIEKTTANTTKTAADKKTEVTASIKAIKTTFKDKGSNHKLTPQELEDMVGKPQYDKIVEALGGAKELDKILETTPPPPLPPVVGSPPASPAGGTPTGGGTAGGTPATAPGP